jgi:Helix-turn-helix domain
VGAEAVSERAQALNRFVAALADDVSRAELPRECDPVGMAASPTAFATASVLRRYQMSVYPGTDATTRAELSDFLKSRRARISPASVGLRNGARRRTPGLRREEVADLAGVGLTWYTWLEQGRDIRVSPQVLAAIARALERATIVPLVYRRAHASL